jgi:hypothetical protein
MRVNAACRWFFSIRSLPIAFYRPGFPRSCSTSSTLIGTWAERSTGPLVVTRMSFSKRTPIPSYGM